MYTKEQKAVIRDACKPYAEQVTFRPDTFTVRSGGLGLMPLTELAQEYRARLRRADIRVQVRSAVEFMNDKGEQRARIVFEPAPPPAPATDTVKIDFHAENMAYATLQALLYKAIDEGDWRGMTVIKCDAERLAEVARKALDAIYKPCPTCKGTGFIPGKQWDIVNGDYIPVTDPCPACEGCGRIRKNQ